MCKISGCRTPAIAQGLCAKHYMRQRRTGDPTAKRKPGPKSKPGPKPKRPQAAAAAAAPSHEVLALRREVASFRAIRKFGRVEKWRGRPYRYWHPGDGYKYWAMTSEIRQSWIINRAKVRHDRILGLGRLPS